MNAIHYPMDLATRILIVDDDEGIRSLISSYLEKHGFVTETAGDPDAMRLKLENGRYDLIVLDVMMPREDGLTALRRLQKDGGPPVIILSAVGTDIDRIVGIEMGAEDYLAKPCNPRELLARIRAVLRRNAPAAVVPTPAAPGAVPAFAAPQDDDSGAILRFAGWRINVMARVLHDPDGSMVHLSDGEFRLLRAFVEHPGRVLTRDQLLEYARGQDVDYFDRAIDVQLSRLRRKMGGGDSADLIRTIRNEGYIFVPPVTR
ncbi:response regulator [Sphingobium sufflavum]|uniref:response regulator n=1 Tax=Sphingobium sufflavum TaxID=1129547 RepID=UPI001F367ABD|nr:response regulator [Sphingobium sufflavum]MCE7795989.1 response regulator [Sphingobium sufflavum]